MTWTECGYKQWDVTCDHCGAVGPDPGKEGWALQEVTLFGAGWKRLPDVDGRPRDICAVCVGESKECK